jgi:hypothetical protein
MERWRITNAALPCAAATASAIVEMEGKKAAKSAESSTAATA